MCVCIIYVQIYIYIHLHMHTQPIYSLPDFPGGQFPEHLLPCAAPLLAALTKAAVRAGNASLNLADQICRAMAAMAANAELQESVMS